MADMHINSMPYSNAIVQRQSYPVRGACGKFCTHDNRIGVRQIAEICQCAAGSQKYMSQALPILLAACTNQDADLRQCAVYGLGILAQHRSAAYQAIAAPALKAITDIIRAPQSK